MQLHDLKIVNRRWAWAKLAMSTTAGRLQAHYYLAPATYWSRRNEWGAREMNYLAQTPMAVTQQSPIYDEIMRTTLCGIRHRIRGTLNQTWGNPCNTCNQMLVEMLRGRDLSREDPRESVNYTSSSFATRLTGTEEAWRLAERRPGWDPLP